MRFAFVCLALLACDLQPPQKKMAVDTPNPTDPAAVPTPPPVGSGSGSGTGRPVPVQRESTKECLEAGVHIAQIMIDDTADVATKAALEQDRTKIVKRSSETCTRDAWSPVVLDCVAKATTQAAMTACTINLKAP